MSISDARDYAISLALERLSDVDLSQRAAALGLSVQRDVISTRFLDRKVALHLPDLNMACAPGEACSAVERLLLLHYLTCEETLIPSETLMTFRELPGGAFYYDPFRKRSAALVERMFQGDISRLQARLQRFTWKSVPFGDLGARVHAFGHIHLTLVYHLGDSEFPDNAEVLFDPCVKQALSTEDAAALAGHFCARLLQD